MSDKTVSEVAAAAVSTAQFVGRKFVFEVQTTSGHTYLSNAEDSAELLNEFGEDAITSLTKYELVNPQVIDMATFFEDVEDDDDDEDDGIPF